ncbi:hypothetical protein [Streptomyces sp. NBC_00859]|uniref:hypothetical protein n=1 Tax=Streptomyces sp. NBC_00859 TaxID=2903682 RepID=UPI00386BA6B1|nr:hypothetical protein OG584_15085 [Streptomyces sp. NBC_00859]
MTSPTPPSSPGLPHSATTRREDATQAPAPVSAVRPKGDAEGVPIAVRSDPHTITVSGIGPGLHLRGLNRGEIPVADWLCACGHHERARGRAAVTELATRVRVGHCPHNAPAQNRRDAA